MAAPERLSQENQGPIKRLVTEPVKKLFVDADVKDPGDSLQGGPLNGYLKMPNCSTRTARILSFLL